ncbi:uncharacterized protein LOC100908183 [Galendromus occidentalis]|uniref:Uncharacterized protein LOC100908183 n=1 Tax=Galendromus occidentalis TaxID=34638 RepID=A0AAJ6QYD1_9ACAR|nr:uncharacterized protein LOC100908183 [Galendromus occidentalis]
MDSKWNEKISNNTSDATRALQRVFVGYLKPHITRKDLFEIFRKYGEIAAISINRNGYGFVEFANEESALLATDENGRPNKGGVFQVKQCSPGDVRKKAPTRDRSRSPLPPSRATAPANHSPRRRSSPNPPHDHRSRSPTGARSSSSTSKPKPADEVSRKPNDCEIVVMSKQLRDYAETVERRLKNLGLKVDVLFMKDEALLTQALDDLSLRGTLYACVIAQQHEVHNSVTLNVLYGIPQEHRNMPIDEALKFLAKNFREHLERQRDRDSGDDEREIKFLLKLVIESRYISINEYDRLIDHLRLKRDQLIKEEIGDSRPVPAPSRAGSSSYQSGSNPRGTGEIRTRPGKRVYPLRWACLSGLGIDSENPQRARRL